MITTVAVVARFRVYQEILADVIGSCPELAVIGVAGVASATQIIRLLIPDVIVIEADVPELVTILFAARSASVRTVVMGFAPGNVECDVLLPENARTSDLLDSLRIDRTALDVLGVHRSSSALTRRESQVMRLVGRGYSNKEIATELSVSLATVKSHVHSVLRKVGHIGGATLRQLSGRTTGEDLSGVAPARLYIQPAPPPTRRPYEPRLVSLQYVLTLDHGHHLGRAHLVSESARDASPRPQLSSALNHRTVLIRTPRRRSRVLSAWLRSLTESPVIHSWTGSWLAPGCGAVWGCSQVRLSRQG